MDNRCIAIKGSRRRCHQSGHPVPGDTHLILCSIHRTAYYRHVTEIGERHQHGRCFHYTTAGQHIPRMPLWCREQAVDGEHYCEHHIRIQRADDLVNPNRVERVDRFGEPDARWAQRLEMTLNEAMNDFFRDDPRREQAMFGHFWGMGMDPGVAMLRGRPGLWMPPPRAGFPEPAALMRPIPRLEAIARDNQNVHTTEVSTQTNSNIAKLLAVPIPPEQNSRDILFTEWNLLPNIVREEKIRVALDVDRFFNMRHCRTAPPQEPDDLYRKMMRGLVAYIGGLHDNEVRKSLWRRTFEECQESVDMCVDGHISRLANVLVGFDSQYLSPVSRGELIQTRIAAIGAMEVQPEERTRLAHTFFDEIGLPAPERTAWIEALVE